MKKGKAGISGAKCKSMRQSSKLQSDSGSKIHKTTFSFNWQLANQAVRVGNEDEDSYL